MQYGPDPRCPIRPSDDSQTPGFAVVAVLALAVGIGANSAVFSVINAVLLRPLAFAELDRLVDIRDSGLNRSGSGSSVTPADYLDWKARAVSFDRMAAYSYANFQIGSDGADPAGVFAARIKTDLLTTLGTKPAHGRDFGPDEEDVAFISDSLWRDRFAADPAVVGRTILIDRKPHIVVGIMPANFDFPLRARRYGRRSPSPPRTAQIAHDRPCTSWAI